MIILGLDPGTATTGYGLIKVKGKSRRLLEYGLIKTVSNKEQGERLKEIHLQLKNIIKKYNPDFVVVEKLFFARNAKTAIQVGQAQGVLIFTAALMGKRIIEYSPRMIKKVVTGNGNANKKEVQKYVRKFLGQKVRRIRNHKTYFDDSVDALATALCYIELGEKGGENNAN